MWQNSSSPLSSPAQLAAQDAGGLLGVPLFARRKAHEASGGKAQSLHDLLLALRNKLADAAHQLALVVQTEPVGFIPGLDLHVGAELVDLFAGGGEVRDHHGLDRVPGEGLEAAVSEERGGVLDGQVNAQVRLVGAVGLQGVVVGDAPEGGPGGPAVGPVLGEDWREHVLHDGEHVVLVGEAHLHVQLVELAGGAVAPGVLVPEAGGDLEILVDSGGH